MSNFKRVLKIVLIVIAVLAVAASGYYAYTLSGRYNAKLAEKDKTINELTQTINNIGDLATAYVLRADVIAGKEIIKSDLEPIDIPASMTTGMVTDLEDIEGKYYMVNLSKGAALLTDNLMEDKLDDSMRLFDVVTDENPLGLKPGSYVDIRISMPLGEDFVAMTHKRVHGINNGILKLAVNENDIHAYNSMLVDKIMYEGTRIYAVEYAQPGAQKPARDYYPISKNILAIAEKDPNLLSAVQQDMITRRDQLEASLKSSINSEIAKIIAKGKQTITDTISEGDKLIQKQWEEEEAARKKAEEAQKKAEAAAKKNNQSNNTENGVVN